MTNVDVYRTINLYGAYNLIMPVRNSYIPSLDLKVLVLVDGA